MILLVVLVGVFFAVLLAGFYAGMETAAYRASSIRLRHLAQKQDARAAASLHLLRDVAHLVTTTLIGHNLAVNLATFLLTHHFATEIHVRQAELWATVCLTPLCFLFAEVLPKRLAHAMADAYTLRGVRVCQVSRLCFFPLGVILGGIANMLRRLLTRLGHRALPATGRSRLMEHLEAGAAEDVLSEAQNQMAQRIMAIDELRVGDVMIPVARAVLVREDTSCREAAEIIHRAGLRRVPLCDRADQPTGKAVALNSLLRNPASLDQPVAQLGAEMISLDMKTSVAKSLRRLKGEAARIALVTGRGGKPIGVVTASDLLGRVVGGLRL